MIRRARPRLRTVLAAATAAALVPALAVTVPAVAEPPAPQSARVPAPTPGAAGIGDPYYPDYGNGGYNVSSYAIKVGYTPSTGRLTGKTTIKARASQALSRFNLDLVLKPSAVTVNGVKAAFSKPSTHELRVTPKKALANGARMTVVVHYAGKPASIKVKGVSPWTRTKAGGLAVGEPEIAAWWFPSNDHPRDKAAYDISVTVPRGTEAISNGRLRSKRTKGTKTTWHWRQHKPMATYLAYFAVGQYKITTKRAGGRPFISAIPAKSSRTIRAAAADLKRTPEVIAFESSLFGPYPFSEIGGVVTDQRLGYALETQTRPIYDKVFWDGGRDLLVVVHENAHQWFGDSVSVRNWRDIWLNEGFASFAEWLWLEKKEGVSAQRQLADAYAIPAGADFWKVKIGNPGAGEEFDSAVYDRGAMTLQALRNRIGDKALMTLLRTWTSTRRYGHGDIASFVALAEKVSGQQLDGFFTAWLFTATKPAATAANGLAGLSGASRSRSAADVVQARERKATVHRLLAGR